MRMRSRSLPVSIFVLSLVLSIFLLAPRSQAIDSSQDPPTPPTGGQEQRPGFGRQDQAPEPKPYDRVITKEAKSDEGIFTIHTVKERSTTRFPRASSGRNFSG
jgi:hypothetical protein